MCNREILIISRAGQHTLAKLLPGVPLAVPAPSRVTSSSVPSREPFARFSPGKLIVAKPGGGVAEDDRRTPERSNSSDSTHGNDDAFATVHNNLDVVIDGREASALLDIGAEHSDDLNGSALPMRKVMTH